MKKLKVGIVGAGNIATGAHLPSYQELKDIVEVAACLLYTSSQHQRGNQA